MAIVAADRELLFGLLTERCPRFEPSSTPSWLPSARASRRPASPCRRVRAAGVTHHRSIMSYTSIDRMNQPSESDGSHPENCRWDGVPRAVPGAAHPERHPFRL